MKRFFRKRVPAFLLALVMAAAVVPMASAKSSADIEYEVDAGDKTYFDESDFADYYDRYCYGTFEYVVFSVSKTSFNNFEGSVALKTSRTGVEDFTYSEFTDSYGFYYDDEDYGKYDLSKVVLTADDDADDDTLDIDFTVYGEYKGKDQYESGTLRLTVNGGSSSGTISYSVKPGNEVTSSKTFPSKSGKAATE